jgi:hypothetical protein
MGVIWLQTTDGRLIHLPIVEADVNTPDSPVKVPVSSAVSLNVDRCLSGTRTVNLSSFGYGTVTLDFGAPGRSGSCNQCGSCCTHPVATCPMPPANCGYILDTKYNVHKCQYLTINAGTNKLGKPGQTSCSIRTTIFDIAKGCTLEPSKPEHIMPWMTACGFTFG